MIWLLVFILLALNLFDFVSDGFVSGVGIGILIMVLTEPENKTAPRYKIRSLKL